MTTQTEKKTLVDLAEFVREVSESMMNTVDEFAGSATPEAGELPCVKCEGTGGETRESKYHPSGEYFARCHVCHGRGWHEAPQLDLILKGLYTDRPHLRPRKGYGLSPSDLKAKGANETTVDLYTYIRARWQFDLGKNFNIGGMIMNNLDGRHPFKNWAEAVNAALLVAHGRSESAGGRRWEQAGGPRFR